MTKPKLSEADFARAAASLGVPVAAVKSVCQVEAPKGGFLPSGEPTLLFERHIFSRLTVGTFDKEAPDLSDPEPGGYIGGQAEHDRLFRAVKLDRDAALQSASWGKFQIMGFNHAAAGFPVLQAFINAMYEGEPQQLDAFVHFIKADPKMHRALQAKDWATVAHRYNGKAYAKNKYDVKLAAAYKQHGGT